MLYPLLTLEQLLILTLAVATVALLFLALGLELSRLRRAARTRDARRKGGQ